MTQLYDRSNHRKYLNPDERLLFYRAVKSIDDLAHRSFCITMLYTGCRISEALELRTDRIDQSERTLVFKTLKQRGAHRIRAVPVPTGLIELLLNQAAGNKGSRLWKFSRWTGRRIVKKYMAAAGLSGIKATPRGLRHSFAIDNLTKGVPLSTISKWLGHTRIETSKIYVDYVGPEERALASRAWPDRTPETITVNSIQATSTIEIETFSIGENMEELQDSVNARIKIREAAGWTVLQIEQLTGHDEKEKPKSLLTKGILIAFIKPSGRTEGRG